MIVKFDEFFEKKRTIKKGDYGCVMIYPKIDNWDETTSIINKSDIYKNGDESYGIIKDPHITVLFGLHSDVTLDDVRNSLKKFKGKSIDIDIDGIGKFDNDDFSVVKLNVNCDILHKMNKELSKLPHTTNFTHYSPHMTIAYVLPGKASKYVSDDYKVKFKVDKIIYYTTDDEYKEIDL